MARVLHVYAKDCDLQTAQGLRTLSAGDGFESVARTIGKRCDYTHAIWAAMGLRSAIDDFDVVHAWDTRSLTAVVVAGAKRIVFTAPPVLRHRHFQWLRIAARSRQIHIVCATPYQRQVCLAAGIAPEMCHLIRPALPVGNNTQHDRADIRRRLGLADDEFVLIAPGESTRPAAHERAVWATSILHVVDERYRALLWGRGHHLDVAANLGRRLRQPRLVVVGRSLLGASAEFETLLAAADAMLITARGPVSVLPIGMAMQAGVPIIAVETPLLSDVLIDNQTALTVPTNTPRLIAQRVLDLRADPDATRSVISRAREHAATVFAPNTMVAQYARLYRKTSAASERLTLAQAAAVIGVENG